LREFIKGPQVSGGIHNRLNQELERCTFVVKSLYNHAVFDVDFEGDCCQIMCQGKLCGLCGVVVPDSGMVRHAARWWKNFQNDILRPFSGKNFQNDILRPNRGVAVRAGATFLAHGDKTPFHRAGCIGIFCEQALPTLSIMKIPAHHSADGTSCQVRAVKARCSTLPRLLRTFQQTRGTPLPCHIERTVLDRRGTTTIWTHTASITHSMVCHTSSGISAFGACPIAASIRGVDAAWSSQKQAVGLA